MRRNIRGELSGVRVHLWRQSDQGVACPRERSVVCRFGESIDSCPPASFHSACPDTDSARLAWLQGLGQATTPRPPPSALASFLLEQWAWGHMSAPQIQKIAACAEADGLAQEEIKVLAGLGGHGRYARNCHPELLRRLQPHALASAIGKVEIPIKAPQAGFARVQQEFVLPHQLFAALYERHPEKFRERFLGAEGKMTEFWAAASRHPMLTNHAVLSRRDYRTKGIPISLHGDGVPVAGIGKAHLTS